MRVPLGSNPKISIPLGTDSATPTSVDIVIREPDGTETAYDLTASGSNYELDGDHTFDQAGPHVCTVVPTASGTKQMPTFVIRVDENDTGYPFPTP